MSTPLPPLARPLDLRTSKLGEEVYRALGEAILDGTLAPGDRLRDQDLAEWLGVSRTPVREALLRLVRIGLVEMSPHRYTRVSVPDPQGAADTDEFMRYVLSDCLRLVLDRGDDDVIAQAAALARLVVEASARDDRLALWEASATLFTHIVKECGNRTFLRVFLVGELALRRDLASWNPAVSDVEIRTDLYRALTDAIVARDGDTAESVIHRLHGVL